MTYPQPVMNWQYVLQIGFDSVLGTGRLGSVQVIVYVLNRSSPASQISSLQKQQRAPLREIIELMFKFLFTFQSYREWNSCQARLKSQSSSYHSCIFSQSVSGGQYMNPMICIPLIKTVPDRAKNSPKSKIKQFANPSLNLRVSCVISRFSNLKSEGWAARLNQIFLDSGENSKLILNLSPYSVVPCSAMSCMALTASPSANVTHMQFG